MTFVAGLASVSVPVPGHWQWGPDVCQDGRGPVTASEDSHASWQNIDLYCISVGHYLIALRWHGRTHWLWHDAVDPGEWWQLKRYLLGMEASNKGRLASEHDGRYDEQRDEL
ncbi:MULTISPECIES: hypothetical protein [Halomonas]|uniref:hypothetical protein n=1 Tax=Halomonas TaxID=2745 RepID=UPI001C97CA10|nr:MULTISPECIES: hypothetical protein [Halomonas]MBY6208214.1 hypothetical protein [Halomonas sp. DP3Y7-2]MBY6229023.1 hypothetical protein [Halomonas sp. DP3Y7-1]MCA0916993.1 hypothetical protein [Halomonas denitrificans]